MEKILNLYKKYKEIINYLIFGALTTVIGLGVKFGLLFTILKPDNPIHVQIAVVVSWILSVIFAYITNRLYVFESTEENTVKEFSSFLISRITTLLLEMLIMWFFLNLLELNSNLCVIIFTLVAQIFVIIANYLLSKLFVFKK